MKFASWIIFGAMIWFALPVIVPLAILYIMVRMLNAVVIGDQYEEVNNDN